ncbi:protein kinase domain-containing protein [Streptomyces sp. PR69]|uniref:protein kinase domain-containing protein n=1 Tax=Streptomyces sp. PR69 TaxID=2984950 RepID=UPI0022649BC5|nr:protein kinase [Streptomyces sp. PR69]
MAPEPEAGGGGVPDAADSWGIDGLVGDGRYRLTHRLGRGGMAEVFAAEDVRLGRTVAVKLLRADLAEDPVSKARFTREAQSVAGLNHHAVVAVYDSGEDAVGGHTVPYIVMELVEGRTIRDLLVNAEAPPPEQALIIVAGVLEALAYSHQHGIVHRDIKPANVIITNSGAVKVMDFGIARALHGAQATMTQTGMVMGTPQYLSPEQALGKAVDHRSDLYATGCLLYELLALRPPFTGETPLSVVYQHVQDMPVPPSQVLQSVPPELDGLVMRSLAKDPDDRFQSAEEMRGLVQYALQMLHEQGGHTGVWNTGPVALPDAGPAGGRTGGATPATGTTGPTAVMGSAGQGRVGHGDTSQGPILPPMNPDDGAYGGYDDGYGGSRPGRRGGRGKVMLFAALAVIAIVAGVAFALDRAGGEAGGTTDSPSVSESPSQSDKTSPTPSEEQSEPDGQDQPDTSSGQNQEPPRRPSFTPSYTPSFTPSNPTGDPTGTPSTPPTGDPTDDPTGGPTNDPTGGTDPDPGDPDPGGPGGPTSGGDGGATSGSDRGGDDGAE